MPLFLFLLLAASASALTAGEFTFEIKPSFNYERVSLEGVTMTVTADPLWGCENEDGLEKFKAIHGNLPQVTMKGSGVTARSGRTVTAQITVTVSWTGELPTNRLKQADGSEVDQPFAMAMLVAKLDGYHTATSIFRVEQGKPVFALLPAAIRCATFKGRVVHEQGQRAAANLKLAVVGELYPKRLFEEGRPNSAPHARGERHRFEFTTDTEGNFNVTSPELSHSPEMFFVAGHELAFAIDSKAWRPHYDITRDNTNFDYGTLIVVPGGGIKGGFANVDTGETVPTNLQLMRMIGGRTYPIGVSRDAAGSESEGIPAGTYEAVPNSGGGYWYPDMAIISVESGKVTDLGTIKVEPHRTIEVVAIDLQGNSLPNFTATVTYTGTTPPALGSHQKGKPFMTVRQLTREQPQVPGLFSGSWRLSVRADGFPATFVDIAVPAREPVKVVLAAGGTIEVKLLDAEGQPTRSSTLLAISHLSPRYSEFETISLKDFEEKLPRDYPLPEGIYTPRHAGQGVAFPDLAAGKYLVIASASGLGLMRQSDVEVVPTKVTKVELRPSPGRLSVTVTEKGKPKASVALVVVDEDNPAQDAQRVKTAVDGTVIVEVKRQATYYVLTASEYDALVAPGKGNWNLRDYESRGYRVRFGETLPVTLELFNGGKVNVRLKVKGPSGMTYQALSMRRLDTTTYAGSIYGLRDGEDFQFVNVPVGVYEIAGSATDKSGGSLSFTRKAAVDAPPEQTITIEVKVGKLSLTLTAANGRSDPAGAEVQLMRNPDWDGLMQPHTPQVQLNYRTDAKGKLEVPLLEAGSWHIIARAWKQDARSGRVLADAASAAIEVSATSKVALKFSDNFGALSVTIPQADDHSAHYCRIVLLNAKNEIVFPGDPVGGYGSMWQSFNWWGTITTDFIPVGTYRVIFTAVGYLPTIRESVKIEKGKTTALDLTPAAGCMLTLAVKGMPVAPAASDIQWVAEDAAGKPIKLYGTGYPMHDLGSVRGVTSIHFSALTPEVKRVRVNIPGYEEFVVETALEPGKGQEEEVTLKKK